MKPSDYEIVKTVVFDHLLEDCVWVCLFLFNHCLFFPICFHSV